MAQYDIKLTEISAEMLDELADFAHTAWGRTDILEVEVIPGMGNTGWDANTENALRMPEEASMVAVSIPDPIPASPTGSIEIVLPPEPVEDYKVEEGAPTPITKARKR